MLEVVGIVQHYPWGDVDAIPRLLGREPDGSPQAEWWLGTHPAGPSTVESRIGHRRPLVEVSGPLPYLVKVLAASMPLSLQAHPDGETAAAGFAREEALGIDRLADHRTYRDPHEKTEILCALTRFEALCGFRPIDGTVALLRSLGAPVADELADRLSTQGIGEVVSQVLLDPPIDIDGLVAACREHRGDHLALTQWIDRLGRDHPGDPALVVAAMLNHVVLEPGDAVYLTPGNLHAYLRGVGVEVMGNSDNVVRAGFTSKRIDRRELLRIVRTVPLVEPRAAMSEPAPGRFTYETPGAPFRLTRIELEGRLDLAANGPELLAATEGEAGVLRAGQARYVAPGERYTLTGRGTVFRVEAA
ncbi:MAG: mannose-6-phosphate isomerase, class I [Acidimicrobiia bacterium]